MRQLQLLKTSTESRHGGGLEKGRRKTRRPLTPRLAMHVTFRSEQARGEWSLLRPRHARLIERRLQAIARRFRIRVYQYANSGNHLHLLLKGKTRQDLQNFFRTAGAQIAQIVTGARKGHALAKRFWDSLVFTRLVTPGRDFDHVRWYILKNELEMAGVVAHDRSRTPSDGRELRAPPRHWVPFPAALASKGWS